MGASCLAQSPEASLHGGSMKALSAVLELSVCLATSSQAQTDPSRWMGDADEYAGGPSPMEQTLNQSTVFGKGNT